MKKRTEPAIIWPFLIFIAIVAVAGIGLLSNDRLKKLDVPVQHEKLADFNIDGLSRADVLAGDLPAGLSGDIRIINFFASWCVPCEAEHPNILALSKEMPVFGINYKDVPEKRQAFLDRLGDPYLKIGNDANNVAGIAFGVYGLPTTIVVSRKGDILYRHDGPVTEDEAAEIRKLKSAP